MRGELCVEAIRLARHLAALMPDEPEVHGLLALLLLVDARRPARTTAAGELVRLVDQDRSLWDQAMITEGQAIVRACLRRGQPGPYQLQAAIAAAHSDAPSADQTPWGQIVALYDQLLQRVPSPVMALNRAVAVAELSGPAEGLALVEGLALEHHHLFHATRADLLARLDRVEEAVAAYDEALTRTDNATERALLQRRRDALTCPGGGRS